MTWVVRKADNGLHALGAVHPATVKRGGRVSVVTHSAVHNLSDVPVSTDMLSEMITTSLGVVRRS